MLTASRAHDTVQQGWPYRRSPQRVAASTRLAAQPRWQKRGLPSSFEGVLKGLAETLSPSALPGTVPWHQTQHTPTEPCGTHVVAIMARASGSRSRNVFGALALRSRRLRNSYHSQGGASCSALVWHPSLLDSLTTYGRLQTSGCPVARLTCWSAFGLLPFSPSARFFVTTTQHKVYTATASRLSPSYHRTIKQRWTASDCNPRLPTSTNTHTSTPDQHHRQSSQHEPATARDLSHLEASSCRRCCCCRLQQSPLAAKSLSLAMGPS